MPSIYQPRRPRTSPLWQLVHHGRADFLTRYEKHHRKSLVPLRPNTAATVQSFLRCGDLAAGFTRLQCPDCSHERLLAFTTPENPKINAILFIIAQYNPQNRRWSRKRCHLRKRSRSDRSLDFRP